MSELDDCYTVLKDLKNTHWKKVKHEMIAKLENLGAFQLFFTLSCADMRWEENFASIFWDMGMNLTYTVIPNENGFCFTNIEVDCMINGIKMKKELKEFLGDEVDTSIHKLIKGNILLATRFFDQRVKKFVHTIVLGKNHPMNIQHYT